MHPYIELKSFGVSPYPPLSPVLNKSPLASPVGRVHPPKPVTAHSIDNILNRQEKKSPPPRSPSPEAPVSPVRHHPYLIPGRGFEFRPALPVYWPGYMHTSWRDRYTGTTRTNIYTNTKS